MLEPAHLAAIAATGYCILADQYTAEQLATLKAEAEALIERSYTPKNLLAHSVYPSDSTETRVSHALMISPGPSNLPKVEHPNAPTIQQLLCDHNNLLEQITGKEVALNARCMLNYQNYFSDSKPVGEHFDGEYIRAQKAEDGVEFKLLEGILPRIVTVLVIANANNGKGTELVDNANNQVFRPEMNSGDLLIFDNIRLRHRVPTMEHPRTTLGLRNFDHLALHFAENEEFFLGDNYRRIPEGWVSEAVDCNKRFAQFMNEEWPQMQKDYEYYF